MEVGGREHLYKIQNHEESESSLLPCSVICLEKGASLLECFTLGFRAKTARHLKQTNKQNPMRILSLTKNKTQPLNIAVHSLTSGESSLSTEGIGISYFAACKFLFRKRQKGWDPSLVSRQGLHPLPMYLRSLHWKGQGLTHDPQPSQAHRYEKQCISCLNKILKA